ncbi:MAG: aminomethyl-transferring glycine dehydrogenase subunit GcvPB [Bacteriovoracaceae bacterium]|nr:aminomethyl-transferring glycine dehydrogenase subunit GcvPB [Bacteriovoracaceae bacterium]
MSNSTLPKHEWQNFERERKPFYIGASEKEIQEQLSHLGLKYLEDLYAHLESDQKFLHAPANAPSWMAYEDLLVHLQNISEKNKVTQSFIGDGLVNFAPSEIVGDICAIRGLTTAYTPYQPERSQGTLKTLWLYQSLLSELTGFEAINASLYERSSCLFEAIQCALRCTEKSGDVLIAGDIYPGDKEVLATMAKHTKVKLHYTEVDSTTGLPDRKELLAQLKSQKFSVFVFSQTNTFGILGPVHQYVDLCKENQIMSIAIVDPMLLAPGGLIPPSEFGSSKVGADIIVAEGQSLSIDSNFGGPGLGIFGVRYNDATKNFIRSTPGRFIGKAKDIKGISCEALILSTREQHIRREKATSNICSNQSFIASLAGANMLQWGAEGMSKKILTAKEHLTAFIPEALKLEGIDLAFKDAPVFHEVTLKIKHSKLSLAEILRDARKEFLELGIDVTSRLSAQETGASLLKLSFSDKHHSSDVGQLLTFLKKHFTTKNSQAGSLPTSSQLLRSFDSKVEIPKWSKAEVISFYQKLGEQNLSPDDGIYPLGSCTMKYNPHINDWAASLPGFTQMHPQTDLSFAQGNLQILFETQEFFKAITGLAAVTTQPVAGAQGELVGIKLFQAYHEQRGEYQQRNIVLIPKSAHGTNPATATMAGYETKIENGIEYGIKIIDANTDGQIDLGQVKSAVEKFGKRIAGVMITNPNTSGIFESNFKAVAELVHSVGGLVYMDGANMNAIAGWVNLAAIGVDAVHNNLHKTWSIPHGGGGPGDGMVAVSEKLVDFLPGHQIVKNQEGQYELAKPKYSIGSFHRHFGNFAHKVRCYTYIKALGWEGSRKMSAVAVLSSRYLQSLVSKNFPLLPENTLNVPRMHEFILTLSPETFARIEKAGVTKAMIIPRVGKLFLDFGFHAPTVAFPEVYGLMIEPTESYSKAEIEQFAKVVNTISMLINEHPEVLLTVPHFTVVSRVDEVEANRRPTLSEPIPTHPPKILEDKISPNDLKKLSMEEVVQKILKAHENERHTNG